MRARVVVTIAGFAVALALPAMARAQSTPYVGQLMLVPYNFCPTGWAEADGSLMPINLNQALFSLLGTTFGGNGQTTFALPDLRGRVPIGMGQGPGLSSRVLGETGGLEQVTLSVAEIPSHQHAAFGSSQAANSTSPSGALPGTKLRTTLYQNGASPDIKLHPNAIGAKGGSQPHENMQPYLVLNWCIALQGVFPPRN